MYGVDFDQDKVPPYGLFHLDYLLTDGDIVAAAASDDLQAWACYAFADQRMAIIKAQNEQAQ